MTREGLAKRPFGVKRVILTVRRSLPVYPDKQTFSDSVGMSQTCQNRTHETQQFAASSDHLVDASG
jgi:hypothetical protein